MHLKKTLALGLLGVSLAALPAMAQTYPGQNPMVLGDGTAPALGGGAVDCNFVENPTLNCGFETDPPGLTITDWDVTDPASPFVATQIVPSGTYLGYGFYTTAAAEGAQSLITGFDTAAGPANVQIAQDISIPDGGTATLTFDYRGAWDLQTFGAMQNRTFEVNIEPTGGGAPLQTDLIATAEAGTIVTDTGPMVGSVDVSAFTGQDVRVNFFLTMPETMTGPGFIEIDNVGVTVEEQILVTEIPTLDTIGLGIMSLVLVGLALILMVRRRG